jgi:hypothetical protein
VDGGDAAAPLQLPHPTPHGEHAQLIQGIIQVQTVGSRMFRHIVCLATARVFDETISRNFAKSYFRKTKGVISVVGTAKTTSSFRKTMRKTHVY